MTFINTWRDFADGYADGRSSGSARLQRLFGGAVLGAIALACGVVLWTRVGGLGAEVAAVDTAAEAVLSKADRLDTIASRSTVTAAYDKLASALHGYAQRLAAANNYATLLDTRHALGFPPGSFTRVAALAVEDTTASVPNPAVTDAAADTTPAAPSRNAASPAQPSRLAQMRSAILRDVARAKSILATSAQPAPATPPAHTPTIFEKLFGKPAPLTLAYASPDDGASELQNLTTGRYDRYTAVYDISAHTVYMPDGTKLEAHSGLGDKLDDPRYVNVRMRGATPPDVYDLELRESPFHGVRALRLIPVDTSKVFGRSGLLAHTYMLGPNGDSNGCVSFRNYDAFLNAYLNHSIKRLAVVAHLD